jgi:hypothetical protein
MSIPADTPEDDNKPTLEMVAAYPGIVVYRRDQAIGRGNRSRDRQHAELTG